MGNEQSQTGNARSKIIDNSSYFPVSMTRNDSNFMTSGKPANFELDNQENQPHLLLKTAYHGLWLMEEGRGLPPIPRYDQSFVHDKEKGRIVIAYGRSESGENLSDSWAYSIREGRWAKLAKKILSPRTGASSCLVGREMFIFGGVDRNNYYGELHSINIDTGSVQVYDRTTEMNEGGEPCPRIGAVMFYDGESIIVWGGFDGATHSDIHKLHLESMQWEKIEQPNLTGRAAAAHCEFDGVEYVYGSSKMHGLLAYDKYNNTFNPVETRGAEPPMELTRATMVAADEFIFVIGGEYPTTYMHIYALEVGRKWWSAFHIRPDGEMLSIDDGIVNKIGLFMLPREFGSAIVYDEETRSLVSTLGSRLIPSVPIFKIEIGIALGFLHIRSDMDDVFLADGGYAPL